ncbi:chemotaxis protein CheW [Aquibacillus kalidii]|uniref:chemotaxis protein CheW n=1 Tax=Aquibacillus kalidii TaxID=2762597 RepID=UPI0016471723|nr:chemotaxis protein CheW [Aquibacillus kalidii]
MDHFSKTIIFKLNTQEYGANIEQIRSIERLQEIVEMPRTSDFIKGIINMRGQITPIIDLKTRLGLGETVHTENTRILIASIDDIQVGLIVDAATDVIDIDSSVIDEAPQSVNGVDSKYLKGVAKLEERLLLILNLEQVLSNQEISQVKEVVND